MLGLGLVKVRAAGKASSIGLVRGDAMRLPVADGSVDAVTCAKDSMVCAWFENDGKGEFFTRVIHLDQAAYDIRLVDMDGDGDLDVLVAGQNSKNVVWYENRLKRRK